MTKLDTLTEEGFTITPERFNALVFLHKKRERVLYDTVNQVELLRYTSNSYFTEKTSAKDDWKELQSILRRLG